MEDLELIFLGTSQAVPTELRSHTAVLIKYQNETILIDCGEGTQRQFRKAKLNPCKLTRILITHWHGDHILGLPGLLQTLALSNYSKTLQIYGPAGTKRFLSALLDMFIFTGKIDVKVNEIVKDGTFYANDFVLSAFKLKHSAPCLGYSLKEKDKLKINLATVRKLGLKPGPILGKLSRGQSVHFKNKIIKPGDVTFVKPGKKISLLLDTVPCPGCIKTAKNADILISEATYLSDLKEKAAEYKHLTAAQAAAVAKKANAKKLYLTHISQRYELNSKAILAEAKKTFPASYLAKDFLKIKL